MSGARLAPAAAGVFELRGDLDLATVTALAEELPRPAGAGSAVTVDLAGVERADSAGLALLVDWTARAAASGEQLVFRDPPAQLLAIARASGVDRILRLGPGHDPGTQPQ